jgi:hypothetical protein
MAGSCGIPSAGTSIPYGDAVGPEAYSLNVTVVPPSGTPGGYLIVYPDPITPVPLAGSLTWSPNAVFQTGAVITAASSNLSGSVNVVVRFPTDVVIDINGYYAAPSDSGGNTALGSGALANSTVSGSEGGNENTAVGDLAMNSNTSGYYNTAVGFAALVGNTDGVGNVALGNAAMHHNVGGSNNTAVGTGALFNVTSGGNNIGVGDDAGLYLFTSNYNIMIGNQGLSSDDHTIRIGDIQSSTYIAGIVGNTLSGASPVVINSNGQLGVQATPSSRRYKEDIQDMGDASRGLLRLRPVTFHYKKPDPDGSKPLEYGLIAEEVADVYPELVVRGADGQVETVQYSKLPAMLLNELQKEHQQIQEQRRNTEQQEDTIRKLEARLAALEAQLPSATAKVSSDRVPSSGGR